MKPRALRIGRTLVLTSVAALMLSGCTALNALMGNPDGARQSRNSSSLVEFLYPDRRVPPAEDQIPELKVPLRVPADAGWRGPDRGPARGVAGADPPAFLEPQVRDRDRLDSGLLPA